MTRLIWLSVLAMLVASAVLSGCTSSRAVYGLHDTVFHSVDIGNEGIGVVDQVSVNYGGIEIIGGPARARYLPKRGIFGSTGLTTPVPDRFDVHWVSSDGVAHSAVVPSGVLVQDMSTFDGFRISFHDDYVDVYVMEKIATPGPYLNLRARKVFCSQLQSKASQ